MFGQPERIDIFVLRSGKKVPLTFMCIKRMI